MERKQQGEDPRKGILLRTGIPSGTSPAVKVGQVLNLPPFLQMLHIFCLFMCRGFETKRISHHKRTFPVGGRQLMGSSKLKKRVKLRKGDRVPPPQGRAVHSVRAVPPEHSVPRAPASSTHSSLAPGGLLWSNSTHRGRHDRPFIGTEHIPQEALFSPVVLRLDRGLRGGRLPCCCVPYPPLYHVNVLPNQERVQKVFDY